jgi:hypothetical protein
MPEFNDWFPTSVHGTPALNPMAFGAYGDQTSHALGAGLGFASLSDAQNGIGGNGKAYPSATSLDDTADWCALTECFKHAFQRETSPGVWVNNGTTSWKNYPVCIPAGSYITRKPLRLNSIQGAWIYGASPGTFIYNETTTYPDNICIAGNGLRFCRFENITFQANGAGCIAFDLNWDNGIASTVSTNGDIFTFCDFGAPGGVGIAIGDASTSPLPGGYMSSEMTFIRCFMNGCNAGIHINNFNALNYHFLACGGTDNIEAWLKISAVGMVVVSNASLANNGTQANESSYDIKVGSGQCVVLGSRTESLRFVLANGPTTLLGCSQNYNGNDNVFANVGDSLFAQGCLTSMGRLSGSGKMTLDNCTFNAASVPITSISTGIVTPGRVRITHPPHVSEGTHGIIWFREGDEVRISGVASTGAGAASVNGVWTIDWVDSSHFELVGSTFVADTYTLTNARIEPGPHFHLRDILSGGDQPVLVKPSAIPSRPPTETMKQAHQLVYFESGRIFDNLGATGEVVFTLPNLNNYGGRGTFYRFLILAAFPITIRTYNFGDPGGFGLTSRIFRLGGYSTAGTQITNAGTSPGQIGAMLELYLADGADGIDMPMVGGNGQIGHRWLVRAETGTWTISGTP